MKNLRTSLLVIVILFMFHSPTSAQNGVGKNSVKIQELLNQNFQADEPGVTLLVAQDGKIIFEGAAGMANMELDVPMQANHILRIGSVTKQFTAVAILMLQEQGKLKVSDDLTKFIPDYPTHGKVITVEHLLTHTSGIQGYTEIPGFREDLKNDLTPEEMMNRFKDKPMQFDPSEKFRYNNSGYFLLGMIIEKVSGMSYEDFIEEKIFDKIGMNNSYYGNADEIIPNRASGYEMENGQLINAPYLSMTIPYSAGSLLSTVGDLFKWHQAIHAYQVISKASLDQALTPYVLKNGKPTRYGYGWGINQFFNTQLIEHAGGINGFMTNTLYLPKEDIFIAAFSNGKDPRFLTELIAAQMTGNYPEVKRKSLSREQLEPYVGIYQVEGSEDKRTITIKDDHLASMRTGRDLLNLYPFEKDKFYFDHSLGIFEFEKDEAGKVKGIIAHLSNGKKGRATKTDEMPVERKEIKLEDKILERYIGVYEIHPGFTLSFTLENHSLWIEATGEEKLPIFAEGNHRFFLKAVDATLHFIEESEKISKVNLKLGGELMTGIRR